MALEDVVYIKLIDYTAEKSKKEKGRLSLSESANELIALALCGPGRLGGAETD